MGDPKLAPIESYLKAASVKSLLQTLDEKLHATYWEWCQKAKEHRAMVKAGNTPEKLSPHESGINTRIDILLGGLEHLRKLTAEVRRLALL